MRKVSLVLTLILVSSVFLFSCSNSDRYEELSDLEAQIVACLDKLDALRNAIEGLRKGCCVPIVISSIHFDDDWIELSNRSKRDVNIGDWTITDNEGTYTFPEGEVIPVGEVYSISFETYNPTRATQKLWLGDDGDELLLRDAEGLLVDQYCW